MAAPAFQSYGSVAQSSASLTTLTIPMPASTADGNLLLGFAASKNASGTWSAETGWTDHDHEWIGGYNTAFYYKNASSEGSDVVFDRTEAERNSGTLLRITGHNSAAPIHKFGKDEGASESSAVAPSITTTIAECLGIVCALSREVGAPTSGSQPAGSTEIFVENTQAFGSALGTAHYAIATASSTGTKSWTLDASENWIAYNIAIAPESGVELAIPVDSFSLTGLVPTAGSGAIAVVPVKTIALTKYSPAVSLGVNIKPPTAAYTLTGFVPTIAISVEIVIPLGTFTLAAQTPGVSVGVAIITPGHGYTVTPNIPSVAIGGITLPVPMVPFSISKFAPVAATGVIVDIPLSAFTITGNPPVVSALVEIDVPAAAFTVTPFPPAIIALAELDRSAKFIDLNPPFEDQDHIRYLVQNFSIVRQLLSHGVTGTFTTADGKTIEIRNGVVIGIN